MANIKSSYPPEVIEEIITHCKNCNFYATWNGIEEESLATQCVLKTFMEHDFSPELSSDFVEKTCIIYSNMNVMHLLCIQMVRNEEDEEHQNIVNKLLQRTLLDFDINRYLKYIHNEECVAPIFLVPSWTYPPRYATSCCLKRMITNGANVNNNYLLLSICCLTGYTDDVNFDNVIVLLRAGINIGFRYKRSYGGFMNHEETNIYRHLLTIIEYQKSMGREEEKLIRYAKLLKRYQHYKNVITRKVCRYRRKKLANALSNIFNISDSNYLHNLFSVTAILNIIAEYAIPVLIIHL